MFSKRTSLIRWSLLALVFTVLTAQTAVAAPVHLHGGRHLSNAHHLAARDQTKGSAFDGLNSQPRLGVKTCLLYTSRAHET